MKRRTFLLGSTALAAATSVGGILIIDSDAAVRVWIKDVVTEHMDGIPVPFETLEAFSEATIEKIRHRDVQSNAARMIGYFTDSDSIPDAILRTRTLNAERRIISLFLTWTDFFFLNNPKTERITFTGHVAACGNPFARFD